MELVRWWYSHSIHLVLYGSVEKWGGGGYRNWMDCSFIDIQISGNSDLYMICFIRHFFLEGIRGQVSYHSENLNLTLRPIFCCSLIAFVIGQIWRGGGKSFLEGLYWYFKLCCKLCRNFYPTSWKRLNLVFSKKKMMHTIYIPDKQ